MAFGVQAELNTKLMNRRAKNRQMRWILAQNEEKDLEDVPKDRAVRLVNLYEQFERFDFDMDFFHSKRPDEDADDADEASGDGQGSS